MFCTVKEMANRCRMASMIDMASKRWMVVMMDLVQMGPNLMVYSKQMAMVEHLRLGLVNSMLALYIHIDRLYSVWCIFFHRVQCMNNSQQLLDYYQSYSSFDALLCHWWFRIYEVENEEQTKVIIVNAVLKIKFFLTKINWLIELLNCAKFNIITIWI